MDADLSFEKSISEIVPKGTTFTSPICDDPKNGFFQAFLGAIPKHPILRTALDKVIWNIRNKFSGFIYDYTGPRLLLKAYNAFMRKSEYFDLQTGNFNSSLGNVFITKECCWIIHKTCFVANDCSGKQNVLFYSRYKDYDSEKDKSDYWVDLFHRGIVYSEKCQ
jgi:hypothetical protein